MLKFYVNAIYYQYSLTLLNYTNSARLIEAFYAKRNNIQKYI